MLVRGKGAALYTAYFAAGNRAGDRVELGLTLGSEKGGKPGEGEVGSLVHSVFCGWEQCGQGQEIHLRFAQWLATAGARW